MAARNDAKDNVCVGAIAGAVGVRGDLRIKPFTQDPLDVASYGPLLAEDGRSFSILRIRTAKDGVVAHFDGIEDRDAALALKGSRLYVPRGRLPAPADADEYYHADLIGLVAIDEDGRRMGQVKAVHDFGAGAILEIAGGDGQTIMVPFTRAAVPRVEIEAGRLVVDREEAIETGGHEREKR